MTTEIIPRGITEADNGSNGTAPSTLFGSDNGASDDNAINDPSVAGTQGTVQFVAVNDIEANPFQPRKRFTEAKRQELEASVKRNGVLQAILLRPNPDAEPDRPTYQLVAGERRWRAARGAGLKLIPALVRFYDDRTVLELALEENLRRHDIDAIEEAEGYAQLERMGLTQEQIGARFHLSQPAISNRLRLLRLPESVRVQISEGVLSPGHGIALVSLNADGQRDDEQIEIFAGRAVADNWSTKHLETEVRKLKEEREKKQAPPLAWGSADEAETSEVEATEPVGSNEQPLLVGDAPVGDAPVGDAPVGVGDRISWQQDGQERAGVVMDSGEQWLKVAPDGEEKTVTVMRNLGTVRREDTPESAMPEQSGEGPSEAAAESEEPEEEEKVVEIDPTPEPQPNTSDVPAPAVPAPLPDTPMTKPEPAAIPIVPPVAPPAKSAKEVAAEKATAAPTAKVPEGFLSTLVPSVDCFFCQDAGLTMQDIFGTVRRLIEMGQPLGLGVDDLLTTLDGMLNGSDESDAPDAEAELTTTNV